MPTYKLVYFDAPGRAECARQLFSLAGVEFEDFRFTYDEWPQYKKDAPFGTVPYLEVDGKKLAQSMAINRYLAKQFGFYGKDDWEAATLDALADQYTDVFDFNSPLKPFYLVLLGREEGDKDKLYNELFAPARDKFFAIIQNYLKKNSSGYLVGDKVSYVDLMVAANVSGMEKYYPDYAKDFPEIVAHKQKIHSIPSLKKWMDDHPQ